MKKLIYLILILPFLFITNVNAQTYQLSFNTLRSTSQNLDNSFQCNNNLCVVYGAEFMNIPFSYEWGTTGSPTCSSTAVVSGKIHTDNVNFGVNNNDYSYNKVYLINNNVQSNCSFQVGDSTTDFVCTSTSLSSNFKIGFTLNPTFGGDTTLNTLIYRSIDINCDTSTGQIIDNQNQNTQNIINNQNSNTTSITNNQNQNTQNIINNQNSNTNSIINNQNQNTQQEIESQRVCNLYDKTSGTDGYLNNDGGIDTSSTYVVTNFLSIDKNTKIEVTQSYNNGRLCFYDMNKTLVSCLTNDTLQVGDTLTIPNNAYYVRFTIYKALNKPQFKICINGNQALDDSLNNLNDTISSDAAPDTQNELNELDNSLISDTPITDLITLPITLLNSYISGFSGTCSPYNLGNLYGTDLILPCLNLQQRLGSTLWTTIDALFSIFMIYNIAMLFIQAFEGFTSLRDDYEGLYQPKHADTGYQPKHGGDS